MLIVEAVVVYGCDAVKKFEAILVSFKIMHYQILKCLFEYNISFATSYCGVKYSFKVIDVLALLITRQANFK